MVIKQAMARFLYLGFVERPQLNYFITKNSWGFHYEIKGISTFLVIVNSFSNWITAMKLQQLLYKTIKFYITGMQFYYVELEISKKELNILLYEQIQQ